MKRRPFLAFDIETAIIDGDPAAHVRGARVVLAGVAGRQRVAITEGLDSWRLMASRRHAYVTAGHNLPFDIGHVLRAGFAAGVRWLLDPATLLWDTQTVHYLMDGCATATPSLEESCAVAGIVYQKDEWAETAFKQGIGADVLYAQDPERLKRYLAGDLGATLALAEWQRAQIVERTPELLRTVYVQMRALKLVCLCHHFGMPVDLLRLREFAAGIRGEVALFDAEVARALDKLITHPIARTQFNLDSPAQVAALLYGGDVEYKERIPAGVFKTGQRIGQTRFKITRHVVNFPSRVAANAARSADENALTRLRNDAATPPDALALLAPLMGRRAAVKVLGTYCEPFEAKPANAIDGRLHGQFNMAIANTGRKTSSGPNLQNIPDAVRASIAPGPGRKVLAADFKQLEIIGAAYLSRDPALMRTIHAGKDVHALTKRRVDKRTGLDTPRTDIKRINFGRIYGGGPNTLAAQSGVALEVVREAVRALDTMFPGLAKFFRVIEAELNRIAVPVASEGALQEYVADYVLPTGRRLRFKTEGGEWPFTGMKNRPIQAFATADIVPFAEMLLVKKLWDNIELVLSGDVWPIVVVHDEIDVETSERAAPIVHGWFKEIQADIVPAMNAFYKLSPAFDLPLVVECGLGDTWQEAKDDDHKIHD